MCTLSRALAMPYVGEVVPCAWLGETMRVRPNGSFLLLVAHTLVLMVG